MIIVEGPDGGGKSTLVKEICEHFDLKVGPRATTDRDKLYTVTRQDTYTALALEAEGATPPFVYDRLFWSEMVYSPMMNRDCEFSREEQVFIKRMLGVMSTPIIVCYPPEAKVRENVRIAKQMSGVNENIGDIYSRYHDLFFGYSSTWWYDYSYGDWDEHKPVGSWVDKKKLFHIVERHINERRFREWNGNVSSPSGTRG